MGEGVERLLSLVGVVVAEVDEVAVVRQDLPCGLAALFAVLAESLHLGGGEIPCGPLPLVLGEEGESCSPDGPGVERGILHAARRADVRTYIFCHIAVSQIME